MRRLLLLIFVSLVFLTLGFFSKVYALDEVLAEKGESSEISSFELFWPIVAGKTMGDPLYTLKTLKEKVRGLLIFGKPQKANYFVLLATKRVVEAEKLIDNNEKDLALKTLDRANSLLMSADKAISGIPAGLIYSETKDNINKQLGNLETFIPWLSSRKGELSAKLQEILETVKTLNSKI